MSDFPQYNILYVDDENENLMVFRATFRRTYNVHTARSAAEGFEILQKNDIQVIITDQRMPDTTGIEFLSRTLQAFPDAIRIILTGFSDVQAVIEAINTAQVYRFITKPWNKDDLKMTIDNAIEAYELKQQNKRLIAYLQEANQTLENKVQQRTAELQEKNHNLTAGIKYAKRIQDALLPKLETIRQALPQSFVFFRPRDIVSGDYYWIAPFEHQTLLAVMDCTGHGVPGAFMSLLADSYMQQIVHLQGITAPEQVLTQLDISITKALKQNDGDNRDGMEAAVCLINHQAKTVQFAGAKMPLLYVQNNEIKEISGSRHSAGGGQYDSDTTFKLHTIAFEPDNMFYICSDGYQDQFGGNEGRKFLRINLRKLFFDIHHLPVEQQSDVLLQRLNEWKTDKYEQNDDILVIGFRV